MTFDKIQSLLLEIYPEDAAISARQKIKKLTASSGLDASSTQGEAFLTEQDIILITYGDTLKRHGEPPLKSLHKFASQHLFGVISSVHILPFFPFSSDDGFSVQDFYAVNSDLGDWQDVESLGQDFELMFDAVFNHMSAQSDWFESWLSGDESYAGLIMTEHPDVDLSKVTRPRATPLLTPFQRPNGETIYVWTTFSADQVDFDVRSPDTLIRLLAILLFYVRKGARFIRLDAIAFLWKEAGTTSVHLPQTHAIIQLMRAVLDVVAPHVILITETNVPHKENISYFGDGQNEAQMVYNFTLPPLLFYSMVTGDTSKLKTWVNSLETPSDRTTFFNFTASHDGIGVRPVEGILTPEEISLLIERVESTGGRVSYKRNPDGTDSPYELNVTYVDAVGGADAPPQVRAKRFLMSQTIALSLAGVPGIYIHSLLGTTNDIKGMEATGHNRRINRAKLDVDQVERQLADDTDFRSLIFHEFVRRIQNRREQPAFHPNGEQVALDVGVPGVFALKRKAPDGSQEILCIYNLSDSEAAIDIPDASTQMYDLIGNCTVGKKIVLEAYQSMWIKMR